MGFGILLLAGACVLGRELRRIATDTRLRTATYEDVYYLPPARTLRALSLGYDEALADLIWMKALIYFGDELLHRGGVVHVFHYADAILALDPHFRAAYRWAGTAGMYRPAGYTEEDIRGSLRYLERAVEAFPDDGELAWDLGAGYAFELAPIVDDPEERARLKARGIEHMQAAARLGEGPPWLVLSNATQLERLGQTEQAIRHLEEMYATTRDTYVRTQIETQLERLRSAAYAEAFQRAYGELEAQRLADFPYLDSTMYLLVGPRPPVDEARMLRNRFAPAAPEIGTTEGE